VSIPNIATTPPLAAFGADQQEQAPLIIEFALFGLGFGLLVSGIGKWHLG
jgi:hypothetical protein